MGGDEVEKANWKKCPLCQKRIRTEKLGSVEELQAWFVRDMEDVYKRQADALSAAGLSVLIRDLLLYAAGSGASPPPGISGSESHD